VLREPPAPDASVDAAPANDGTGHSARPEKVTG
jgi:hypothetical protein